MKPIYRVLLPFVIVALLELVVVAVHVVGLEVKAPSSLPVNSTARICVDANSTVGLAVYDPRGNLVYVDQVEPGVCIDLVLGEVGIWEIVASEGSSSVTHYINVTMTANTTLANDTMELPLPPLDPAMLAILLILFIIAVILAWLFRR